MAPCYKVLNGWWMHQWKYLSSQISASVTGSSCDTVTYVTSVTNARSNTSPRDTPISASAMGLSSKSVKGGRWNSRRKDLLHLSHILPPAAQPITPCHCSPDPSREGRNVGAVHLTSQSSPSLSHLVWSLAAVDAPVDTQGSPLLCLRLNNKYEPQLTLPPPLASAIKTSLKPSKMRFESGKNFNT